MNEDTQLMDGRDIKYREYSPEDESKIVELLRIIFPKWRNLDDPNRNWEWKYLECPNPPEIFVAEDAERIVGVNHRLIMEIKIGESVIRAGYGDDVAVHPDYRQLGVWSDLKKFSQKTDTKDNAAKFGYLATENDVVKDNMTKMGYTASKHTLSHLLKIRDQEAFLRQKEKEDVVTRIAIAALTGLGEVKQRLANEPKPINDFKIVEIPNFDKKFDQFWYQVQKGYDYCIVKDSRYLNWKHSRPTVKEHVYRVALKGEDILGYSVLDVRENMDYREGAVSDLMTLPERLDVANALIENANEHFTQRGVAAIYLQTTTGHPYERLALQNGFIDASSQNKTYFYYRVIGNSIPVNYLENINPSRIQLSYF
jgi:GNAT superfamily N-acetyltransferase